MSVFLHGCPRALPGCPLSTHSSRGSGEGPLETLRLITEVPQSGGAYTAQSLKCPRNRGCGLRTLGRKCESGVGADNKGLGNKLGSGGDDK